MFGFFFAFYAEAEWTLCFPVLPAEILSEIGKDFSEKLQPQTGQKTLLSCISELHFGQNILFLLGCYTIKHNRQNRMQQAGICENIFKIKTNNKADKIE